MEKQPKNPNLKFRKIFLFVFCDFLAIVLSMVIALAVVDKKIEFTYNLLWWFLCNLGIVYFVFVVLRVYTIIVRSAGISDSLKLYASMIIICAANFILAWTTDFVSVGRGLVFSVVFVNLSVLIRFWQRIAIAVRYTVKRRTGRGIRAMIVGAGVVGTDLIREIQNSDKLLYNPVCIVDDDRMKIGMTIGDVLVAGATAEIPALVQKHKVQEILIAMPSVPKKELRRIVDICNSTACRVKILPGVYQFVKGEASVSQLRDVEVTDLLGREQIRVNLEEIMGYLNGQVVLVTGGGGSIGSELCRQLATAKPRQLIILDIYENNAYDIEQELRRRYPELNLTVLIASVRDATKLEDVFRTYRPDIVFNAAAHKHVPLMETSPNEAIKNNVFGTLNCATLADKYAVKTFVQISTDKAVNPTNVMGASKRICEMIIQTIGRHSKNTNFVAVRFGNVLGSNGSVIPLFKRQIAEGGPVTVTHPDIIRYFMTIPEAVMLILQAGAYAKGGQIFVLDMGEPVKIYDLAVNLIRLSGYEPGVDIEVRFTGLRPGEKLYEERLMDEEGMQTTAHGLINVARPIEVNETFLLESLSELKAAAKEESRDIRKIIAKLVTTYKLPAEHEEK